MSNPNPFRAAEQTLKDLEVEIVQRLHASEALADAPEMNAAVGRLTYIDAYQQQQVALHARRKLESQLAAIRGALQRIAEGTYGRCVQCGAVIAPERLEFAPEAARCVKCA